MYNYTLAQLRALTLQRLGWPAADTFATSGELNQYFADSARELHQLKSSLYRAGEWGAVQDTIAITSGTNTYTLPANFFKLFRIDFSYNNRLIPIRRFDFVNDVIVLDPRALLPETLRYYISYTEDAPQLLLNPMPGGSYFITVYYLQTPPTFQITPGTFGDGETSWMGDDEYLILDVCAKCLMKEEAAEAANFVAQKQAYEGRMEQNSAPLDMGHPNYVADERGRDWQNNAHQWFVRYP